MVGCGGKGGINQKLNLEVKLNLYIKFGVHFLTLSAKIIHLWVGVGGLLV